MAYKATSGEDNRTGIFWDGSRAVSTTSTASFDLIIIFDDNDVVIDYSVIAAKIGKRGVSMKNRFFIPCLSGVYQPVVGQLFFI